MRVGTGMGADTCEKNIENFRTRFRRVSEKVVGNGQNALQTGGECGIFRERKRHFEEGC